jgi:hypothetical protein
MPYGHAGQSTSAASVADQASTADSDGLQLAVKRGAYWGRGVGQGGGRNHCGKRLRAADAAERAGDGERLGVARVQSSLCECRQYTRCGPEPAQRF